MKQHLASRRLFLQGLGGSVLAIPALDSLLPRAARAQSTPTPVRYVQWGTNLGQYDKHFWPADKYLPNEPVNVGGMAVAGIKTRALSSIDGPLSDVLGTSFDKLRGKVNLLRGLDLVVGPHLHTSSASSCASWPKSDDGVPVFAHSVDSVLESSAVVYPTPARVRALRITPGLADGHNSCSWTVVNGKPYNIPCLASPAAIKQVVFGAGLSAKDATAASAAGVRLTDMVLDDYNAVVNGNAIGAADKTLLSNYMDLLAGVQSRMQLPNRCVAPSQTGGADYDAMHADSVDLMVAALLCGATRVVAYHTSQGSASQYEPRTFHGWAHTDAIKHAALMKWRYAQLAKLLQAMDAVTESNGLTLLDNSVVYAGNGLSKSNHGVGHLKNMPLMTAGSAGGALTTGQYIDFGGRLVNNLLVTLFDAMGLEPSDYERNGQAGFGNYAGDDADVYASYLSTEARRQPLPFLRKG
jgi:hypothetical protein